MKTKDVQPCNKSMIGENGRLGVLGGRVLFSFLKKSYLRRASSHWYLELYLKTQLTLMSCKNSSESTRNKLGILGNLPWTNRQNGGSYTSQWISLLRPAGSSNTEKNFLGKAGKLRWFWSPMNERRKSSERASYRCRHGLLHWTSSILRLPITNRPVRQSKNLKTNSKSIKLKVKE